MNETQTAPAVQRTIGAGLADATRHVREGHVQRKFSVRELVRQLDDPSRQEWLESHFSNIRLSWRDKARVELLRSKLRLETMTETIRIALEAYETRTPMIPEATLESLYEDDRPVQISGGMGSGKSLHMQQTLPLINAPVFIIDLANEYKRAKRLGLEGFFSIKWGRADEHTRLKFVPTNNSQVAASELQNIFSHLNTVKTTKYQPGKVPSGVLSKWVFIIEESHRVAKEAAFLNFLYEARKFTRKIILVASDPNLFGSTCKLLRPPPLHELLKETKP